MKNKMVKRIKSRKKKNTLCGYGHPAHGSKPSAWESFDAYCCSRRHNH